MLASKIDAYELNFNTNKIDAQGDHYDFTIDNSRGFPLAYLTPKSGISGYFYPETTQKDSIVLHFSCGFLAGDIATLVEQDSRMSVHYVLGRNGVAYQLFNTAYWSYHLGKGCVGGNTLNSKRSVAIEISNIGPLVERGSFLVDIYGGIYCDLSDQQYYVKLPNPYRGYQYYATFTEKQYVSLKTLITYLCGKWNIPRKFLPELDRYNIFKDNASACAFKGIVSHVNYRADGKVDIGPAFDWSKIF
jgi:N-acetyl-anhydromuramyl-L-alanine amidase AmpD